MIVLAGHVAEVVDGLLLVAVGLNVWRYFVDQKPLTNEIIDAGDGLVILADMGTEAARVERYLPFVKEHGMQFIAREYPWWMPTMQGHRCYDAAYEMARHMGLLYCEGFKVITAVDGSVFYIAHAWCYDENLGVIDPTGHSHQNHRSVKYAGVAIKLSVARRWYEHTGYHGILDGLPNDDSPPMFGEPPELWDELLEYRRAQCSDQ